MNLHIDRYEAPLGVILLAWDASGALRALDFSDYEARMKRLLRTHYGDYQLTSADAPETLRAPLTAYFAGDLTALDKVVVQTGGTDFQRQVWAVLLRFCANRNHHHSRAVTQGKILPISNRLDRDSPIEIPYSTFHHRGCLSARALRLGKCA